jgi:hypothetical protein
LLTRRQRQMCIRDSNSPLPTTAAEGANIIRVLEAARNSAFNKRVVGV